MRVNPKSMIRRLTPSATAMLERAAARANTAGHREILPEHLLVELAAPDDGDVACILDARGSARGILVARIERLLGKLPGGSEARPVFSRSVFQLLEDAWLRASVELGATQLRSGALLLQFIAQPERYTSEPYAELEDISVDDLQRELAALTERSSEAVEVVAQAERSAVAMGREGVEALDRYTVNFTAMAKAQLEPVFGREAEIRQMVDVLARRRKNNPIIVGEPGVGKTALVEGLARLVVEGHVPEVLKGVEIRGLDMGLLQAGAGVKGEFENRLKSVISAVQASPTPIVLFIDEAHTLIGAGGPAGGSDAANLLKPVLARGELRTIAATTWAEYKEHIERDAALERRFQVVKVDAPSVSVAVGMLRGLRPRYEESHGVVIRDEGVVAAVELAERYISGRQLPDKAVDLLDTAAARVRVALDAMPPRLEALNAELAGLERAVSALRRDLEHGTSVNEGELGALESRRVDLRAEVAGLEVRWKEERAAAQALVEARKVLDGLDLEAGEEARGKARAKLDAARQAVVALHENGEEALVHAEVTAESVAAVVAAWTGIPVGSVTKDRLSSLLTLEENLRRRVKGQDHALEAIADAIRAAQTGLRDPRTPSGVFLFVGPSGVGKTETAVALADSMYGGERFMTTINMSEYQEKHSVSRLIGAPPGYVGYGKGGVLTEAARQRPYSVVLLDECEKADVEVMNLFYQVFDKGSLTDGTGRDVDFKNTVIILTSNLASDVVMSTYRRDPHTPAEKVVDAIRPALAKHFKPALLARMVVVPFRPMEDEVLLQVTRLKVEALVRRMTAVHNVEATVDEALIQHIVGRCTEPELGARAVDHILRGAVIPMLSRALLEAWSDGRGFSHVQLGVEPSGRLLLTTR